VCDWFIGVRRKGSSENRGSLCISVDDMNGGGGEGVMIDIREEENVTEEKLNIVRFIKTFEDFIITEDYVRTHRHIR